MVAERGPIPCSVAILFFGLALLGLLIRSDSRSSRVVDIRGFVTSEDRSAVAGIMSGQDAAANQYQQQQAAQLLRSLAMQQILKRVNLQRTPVPKLALLLVSVSTLHSLTQRV